MTARVWYTGPSGHTPMTADKLNGIETDLDLRPAKWQPSTAYTAGQQIISPNNEVLSALASFTSGLTFDQTNWSPALNATYATPATAQGIALVQALIYGA